MGYRTRASARLYRLGLAANGHGGLTATCSAVIVGGLDHGPRGRGHFGVKLNLPLIVLTMPPAAGAPGCRRSRVRLRLGDSDGGSQSVGTAAMIAEGGPRVAGSAPAAGAPVFSLTETRAAVRSSTKENSPCSTSSSRWR